MGYFLSRQRDLAKDFLYVEIAVDKKNSGTDILNKRYEGEGKNLYSPIDAVVVARKIMDLWNDELPEESKKIRIAKDSKNYIEYEYTQESLEKLNIWAENVFEGLPKCARCKKIFSGRRSKIVLSDKSANEVDANIYEKLKSLSLCSLACASSIYKEMLGSDPVIPLTENIAECEFYGC
jgi:hypothetical protein